jgi:diguanylate cyclase (GGDEF)-like protein/PAS domain S-box-containing protein
MNVLHQVHPEDLSHVLEEIEKALSEGDVATNKAEYRFRHRDGSWRWMESVGTYLLEDPAVGGVVVTSRDVTERKEAEEALQKSEAEVFSVLESITDGFFALDHEWRFTYVNPQAEALFTNSREDLVGKQIWEDSTFYPEYRRAVTEGRTVKFEGYYPPAGAWYGVRAYPSGSGLSVYLQDITERKRAEEHLREAEERYRSLVETVPAVTYTDRAVGSYPDMALYTSPQIEALVGYSVEEWLNPERDLWEESLHPEDRAWVLAVDERSKATGEPFAEEYRLITKDGRVVWVRDEAALMKNEAGEPLHWQGVLVDVTERKEAEIRLRHSERHFRALTQNSSDVVTLLRAVGTIRYQSPSVERILGYRPEETVGDNVFDYVHPDDRERVEMAFAEGLVDPLRRPSVEYRFRHKDGFWVWLESVGTNLLGDPGVGEYVVNSRDVTGRKEAEASLREAEERYRTMLEAQTELICRFLPDLTLTFVNEAYGRYFGQLPEDLVGSSFLEHIPIEDRAHYKEPLLQLGQKNPTRTVEHRVAMPDGEVRWQQWNDTAIVDENGRIVEYQSVGRDVTERKILEEQLEHRAFYDSLTDLANRQLYLDRLKQALGGTRRRPKRKVGVLFMDLDNFKIVNDSLGHEVGDRIIRAVAERLKECLRPEDTLARFGGDEFTVLIEDLGEPADAMRVAERLMVALREPFVFAGQELFVRPSIGIALGTSRTKSPEELLRDADTAMYRAKAEGLGYRVFEPVMYEQALRRLRMENELRRAIDSEEFVVRYQPIVDLRPEEGVWGVEALVRWQHPERGLLDPKEFVPAAEESGVVVPMGERVLKQACEQAKEWQERYPHLPPLVMAVNLSARQLQRPDLPETIKRVLRETGLEAGRLSLDITETEYIKALERNNPTLDGLKRLGIGVSIDDFGVGYSSLSYLKRLPADAIKIDKSFVRGLGEEVEDTAIVRMMIELAHTLGMKIIAEGVETEEQVALLEQMGCDMGQGYHFARPLPPEKVPEFLAE